MNILLGCVALLLVYVLVASLNRNNHLNWLRTHDNTLNDTITWWQNRTSAAWDAHDHVKAQLTKANLYIEALTKRLKPKAKRKKLAKRGR